MKTQLFVLSLLVSAAFVAGCKPAPDQAAAPATGTAAQPLAKAQTTAKETAQEMKDFAFTQKAEFVAAMQAKVAELNRNLDELSARIEKSNDAAKAEAQPKLAALRAQVAQLNQQVEAANNATATTWDGIKADAQKTYAAVKDGFAQARQWASDKLAP